MIGTLSKAIGVVGGYVAGSKDLIDWLKQGQDRSLLSTSLTPGSAAKACIEAIEMMTESPEYNEKLWENGNYLKAGLKKLGFNITLETPITPVIIGDEVKTQAFSKKLFEEGVYCKSIVFPTVPMGTGRVRNMPTAAYTKELLDEALKIYEKVGKELEVI